jgi:hypothetical protein
MRSYCTVIAMGFLGLAACHRERTFESVCQIVRQEVVEADEAGAPRVLDVELEWTPCPGDQFQVVRGGAAFARCMSRYHAGDEVPVIVRHIWDSRGQYTWDLERVGDCGRAIEPGAEGSFEKSQECHVDQSFGRPYGFTCNRRPFERLVHVCPWMARQ